MLKVLFSGGSQPGTPTIGTATAGDTNASITFTAPAYTGKGATVYYVATSSPSSIVASSLTSPITVTSLVNGTPYTFTVQVDNSGCFSVSSAASNSVTPAAPPPPPPPPPPARWACNWKPAACGSA